MTERQLLSEVYDDIGQALNHYEVMMEMGEFDDIMEVKPLLIRSLVHIEKLFDEMDKEDGTEINIT